MGRQECKTCSHTDNPAPKVAILYPSYEQSKAQPLLAAPKAGDRQVSLPSTSLHCIY